MKSKANYLRSAPYRNSLYSIGGRTGLITETLKAQLLSHKTHYTPTDPEARIAVRPGNARALNYLCQVAVDTAAGSIRHIQADFADRRDRPFVPELVPRRQTQLALRWVGTKSRAAAQQARLLSALAYKPQKLRPHQPTQTTRVARALYPPPQGRCTPRGRTRLTIPRCFAE